MDGAVRQPAPSDRAALDRLPGDVDAQRIGFTRTLDRQGQLVALFAENQFAQTARVHATGRDLVDLGNDIPRADTRCLRRRSGHRRGDDRYAAARIDLDADSDIFGFLRLFHLGGRDRIEESTVSLVADCGDHALRRAVDECSIVDLVGFGPLLVNQLPGFF